MIELLLVYLISNLITKIFQLFIYLREFNKKIKILREKRTHINQNKLIYFE